MLSHDVITWNCQVLSNVWSLFPGIQFNPKLNKFNLVRVPWDALQKTHWNPHLHENNYKFSRTNSPSCWSQLLRHDTSSTTYLVFSAEHSIFFIRASSHEAAENWNSETIHSHLLSFYRLTFKPLFALMQKGGVSRHLNGLGHWEVDLLFLEHD